MATRTTIETQPFDVPGYTRRDLLGGGGFASVWSATRDSDHKDVAIKISRVNTASAANRFEQEARALERLGAPHVPTLYKRGRLDSGRPYLVMELLIGKTLAAWLGEQAKPPRVSILGQLVDAVLQSLQAVHTAGLVHGDLKPDNIFLSTSPTERARLLDFGVLRRHVVETQEPLKREQTREEIVGSAEYMAPEQLIGRIGPSVDVYAVGILLYEMLTLRVPYVGDVASIKHGHRTLRPPRPSLFAEVPEPLEQLCLRCLSKEPSKRPQGIAHLRTLLAHALDAASKPNTKNESRPSRRSSSVLRDARQPVVLLAVEVETGSRAVGHVVERHKGVVARQIGRRYVCGFSALDDAEPIRSALDTAHELVQNYGARTVLHIAQLKVRRRRRGQAARFFGPALQDIRSWKPNREWRGILLTEKLASALPDDAAQPSPEYPGFFELTFERANLDMAPESTLLRVTIQASLVGREDVIDQARASLQAVIDQRSAGLLTVQGESGLGKSRIAHELIELARQVAPNAIVLSIRATRQILGRADETLRNLFELLAEHSLLQLPEEDALTSPTGARLLGDGLRAAAANRLLVLVIDDIHFADGATLDALEYATLDGDDIGLWVAATTHSHLLRRRPQWGQRANRHQKITLQALPDETAMRLAADLLQPAEYPPEATLLRLARWTGGNPQALDELVRTLKREGMVRKRSHNDSWYVATAAIERLPTSPAGQWLAARRLDALPSELAACVRLCAVLGVEFVRDSLEWVQNAADHSGAASSSIDTDIGLAELRRLDILDHHADVWSFRQAAFQDAVYNLIGSRERKRIHRDALDFWREHAGSEAPERALAAIARHARAADATREAANAFLELGERARKRHRDVDADQQYSRALQLLTETDRRQKMLGLGGRGKVRYRIQRTREAIEDLQQAQKYARTLGDNVSHAELLLEEATAHDWDWRFQESAERVELARPLVERSQDRRLHAAFLCALGRVEQRQEHMEDAIRLLEQSVVASQTCNDDELRILALTILAASLTWVNRHEEALARYQELISLCEKTGDTLHLCAAYANKGLVWTEDSLSRVTHDLNQAIDLARQVGQPTLERNAAHNLAEFLHRSGEHKEALSNAHRSYALQRFLPEPAHIDTILLARIHAALEQFDALGQLVSETHKLAETLPLTPSEQLSLSMLELILAEAQGKRDPDRWRELTERAKQQLPGEELLDVFYFRARMSIRSGAWDDVQNVIALANPLLAKHPLWRSVFSTLPIVSI